MAKVKSDFCDRHRKKDFACVTSYFSVYLVLFFCKDR